MALEKQLEGFYLDHDKNSKWIMDCAESSIEFHQAFERVFCDSIRMIQGSLRMLIGIRLVIPLVFEGDYKWIL